MREMFAPGDVVLDISFIALVVEWRGPAPFYFAPIPATETDGVRWAAKIASYGWGCVPVEAEIGGHTFTTALIPRQGSYMLPLKVAIRRLAGIDPTDRVAVRMRIVAPA